ncbi:MAG TPA: hypothetical protein VGW38_01620, partial [Chloroflexota bacterium]|nr:hypothetical protein [Chloroflexota bacterium]
MASVSAALLASCTPTNCTAFGTPSTRRFASFDTPLVEALEDARVEYLPAERAWILSTSALEERLELQPSPGRGDGPQAYRLIRAYLRARDRNIRAEIGSAGGAPAADVLAGVLGIRLQDEADVRGLPPETAEPALVPVGQQVERTEGGLVLTIRFRGADVPAELEAQARLRPGLPVVEHRSRIRNQGSARLHVAELDSANLLVRGSPAARWLAATLDTDGHVWVAALGGEGALVAETPPLSAARLPVVPVLALQDAAAAEGLILALRWSSNYRLLARALSDGSLSVEAGVRLQGGGLTPQARDAEAALATDPTGLRLDAGAVLESPWLLIGFFDGALDAAGNVLREYLSATRPRDPAWTKEVLGVGWNSWFAFGTGVDYDSMLEEANLARQLGVEIFYVDHGWQAAMGDWVPD